MPRIVDHEQRRQEIADALWRVIRRDGFAAASVRTVAAEAGWSTGAIRHYFTSQSELMAFAMATLLERVQARLTVAGQRVKDLDTLAEMLDEVLPLDAQRRGESEVWLALSTAARTDPVLGGLAEEAHRGLRSLCEGAVRYVAAQTGA